VIKKIILLSFMLILSLPAQAYWAAEEEIEAPDVSYVSPRNDSEVDLSQAENLVFSWRPAPYPRGGRECFKFRLFKGFSNEIILTQQLDPQTTTFQVSRDYFQDGQLYTWQVQQRDDWSHVWSHPVTWSFTVKK
jgi:hypothetical protein